MIAAVLTTGTELVRGELVDTNSGWLSAALVELGCEVLEHRTVGDEDGDLKRALADFGARFDVVVVTGGLGPTTDDRTASCFAEALEEPLVRHEPSLAEIRRKLESRGYALGASNAKQADFPASARILPNPVGTAPGFAVRVGRAEFYCMPGVPREMQAIFETHVRPELGSRVPPVLVRKLRTFGKPESHINDALAGLEAKYGVVLGYRASDAEIEVKVFSRVAEAEDPRQAAERARAAQLEVKTLLGRAVYGEGETSLARELLVELARRGTRLAVAESCTGGGLGEMLTAVSGASEHFLGGVVAYDNSVKRSLLAVPEALLETSGAVSAECAKAMVDGVVRLLGADVGVSITGIAGPGGGTPEKPVGLVHFGLSVQGEVTLFHRSFAGDRATVRRRAAKTALFELLALLRQAT